MYFWKEVAGSSDVVSFKCSVNSSHIHLYRQQDQQDKGINLESVRLLKLLHMEDAKLQVPTKWAIAC
jgi:hypothetical protein